MVKGVSKILNINNGIKYVGQREFLLSLQGFTPRPLFSEVFE